MSYEATAFHFDMKFVCVTCTCGLVFAVPENVRQRWVETGGGFHCPMGHPLKYTESDVQKLQKQLDREKRDREWYQNSARSEREAREKTERRLIARKGANTRLRNRVKNGVCPCCTRTFMNLQQHMKNQHPGFQPDDEASGATVNGDA